MFSRTRNSKRKKIIRQANLSKGKTQAREVFRREQNLKTELAKFTI